MVPADDESTSTNESEEDTSTRGTFFERFKFWKRDKKDANEPARLKTLPQYLMHWTTPVWIAAAGFLIALAFAVIWRGECHWPSAAAMKLCATIAGAGFAFSAWQQRSHDNVVKEKQAQATVERDDYWKRREQIYQLLGTKNPGLRLSAVALLAELADTAADSTLLNETEKQQLQRHIIDTLCLQVRHEGLCLKAEGTNNEHQQIQTAILRSLFDRINNSHRQSNLADWSKERISMTNTHFIAPFFMAQVKTSARIILNRSTFEQAFTISESRLNCTLHTKDTTFLSTLTIFRSHISVEQIPVSIEETGYIESTITHKSKENVTKIKLSNDTQKLLLQKCNIHTPDCTCPPSCECKQKSNNNCLCKTQNTCSCGHQCTHTQLNILFTPQSQQVSQRRKGTHELTITDCETGSIRLSLPANHFQVKISGNVIHGHLEVEFQETSQNNSKYTRFVAEHNSIAFTKETHPIALINRSNAPLRELCVFTNNFTFFKTNGANEVSKLQSQHISKRGNVIHFQFHYSFGDKLQEFSWDTGSLSST